MLVHGKCVYIDLFSDRATGERDTGDLQAAHHVTSDSSIDYVWAAPCRSLLMMLAVQLVVTAFMMRGQQLVLAGAVTTVASTFVSFVIVQGSIRTIQNSVHCAQCTLVREFHTFVSCQNSYQQ